MTNEQILKKAIEKAVENGFKFHGNNKSWSVSGGGLVDSKSLTIELIAYSGETKLTAYPDWVRTIFSHEFAKAFWGEEEMHGEAECYYGCCMMCMDAYLYHLSKMVLEEEPLLYIEKFLDNDHSLIGKRTNRSKTTSN